MDKLRGDGYKTVLYETLYNITGLEKTKCEEVTQSSTNNKGSHQLARMRRLIKASLGAHEILWECISPGS